MTAARRAASRSLRVYLSPAARAGSSIECQAARSTRAAIVGTRPCCGYTPAGMTEPQLQIFSFQLGPASTNAYLVGEPASKTAVVIDPAWDGERILAKAKSVGWRITNLWLTHAHFDHFGGAAALADGMNPAPPVALHPQS